MHFSPNSGVVFVQYRRVQRVEFYKTLDVTENMFSEISLHQRAQRPNECPESTAGQETRQKISTKDCQNIYINMEIKLYVVADLY